MREKVDARVIRTKEKLVSSFMDLIGKDKFENITVNDICEHANVKRATFYKHYTDKYDFFKYVVVTLRDSFDEKWNKRDAQDLSDYFSGYAFSLIDFFDSHDDVISKLCQSTVSSTMFSIALSQNLTDTKLKLEAVGTKAQGSAHSVNVFSSMLVGGVFHTLINWVQSGKSMPKEELKSELEAIIEKMNK